MFRNSNFEKNLENATSHLRLEPDWPSILLICDAIRQNDVGAKQAFAAIKKKMVSPNPHSAYYALLVLESVVKNCGLPIHEEIFTKENCEMFSTFLEETPHENVREKMLELVQTWAYAFRSSEKYQSIKDTMTILKTKGHTFPELKEADAMFTADTAPDWADGKVCHQCRVEFSFTQRKHHCRNCGQIFCAQCSTKQCPLPKYGIEKDVRVCDRCFSALQKPQPAKRNPHESDLPAEYLNSTLAQQPQKNPPRKSEQELSEEEELQLAIALSQSEAEQSSNKKVFGPIKTYQHTSNNEKELTIAKASQNNIQEQEPTPELAKYLNRSYWEQKKNTDSPASPSAPSPMPQLTTVNYNKAKNLSDDEEINDFAFNMKSQVEIFVNRMKSNSSRGRNISNDSSVQTLFMNLTSLHSQLLTYIKQMDDKRMWCEQLQDKLTQVKDSRAALDVLRQEYLEKVRKAAEEQERQRQLQMAQKLEIMRKKKQEYLQYQRQLALQRIQEQEREMQIRQEQQKAQYRIGQAQFSYVTPQQHSTNCQMNGVFVPYNYNQANTGAMGHFPPSPHNMPQSQIQVISQMGHIPDMYLSNQQPMSLPGQIQNPPAFISMPTPNFTDNISSSEKNNTTLQSQQILPSNFPQNTLAMPSGVAVNPVQGNTTQFINADDMNVNAQEMSKPYTTETENSSEINNASAQEKTDDITTAELIKFD